MKNGTRFARQPELFADGRVLRESMILPYFAGLVKYNFSFFILHFSFMTLALSRKV